MVYFHEITIETQTAAIQLRYTQGSGSRQRLKAWYQLKKRLIMGMLLLLK